MTAADVATLLQSEFAADVTGVAQTAPTRPSRSRPAKLVEVCQFLRDDPRLKFEMLNDISGVDYLETDPKKVAKAGFEPHLEVVYHLSSFSFPGRRFTLKVVLPRWKDDDAGRAAGGAERRRACGRRPTGRSAKSTTWSACSSPATRIWCGFCSATTGSATRSARTTSSRSNTTAFAAGRRRGSADGPSHPRPQP